MGRNPAHLWVGESVPLDYANVITTVGDPVFDDFGDRLRYRVRDDGSSTMDAGDSFIAGFYDSSVMLSGDDVEASFVIVCTGSGTIRLSGGFDPDWSLDDPGDATVPMGTHTVSGDTVIVGDPFPSFDVDTYLSQVQETIVYVECLTGTVEVNQVKLRLWPTAGPTGAWVLAPGFTIDFPPEAKDVDSTGPLGGPGGTFVAPNPTDAFGAAALALMNDAQNPARMQGDSSGIETPFVQSVAQVYVAVAEDTGSPGTFNAGSGIAVSATIVRQPDPIIVAREQTPRAADIGTFGVDYSWPPDEVPGDLGIQLTEPATTAWGAMSYTVNIYDVLPDGPGPAASLNVTVVPDEAFDDPSLVTIPYPEGYPIPGDGGIDDLPLPSGFRTALVSLTHRFFETPPTYGGGAGGLWQVGAKTEIDAPLVDSTVTIPPYLYWSPTATATVLEPLRLRQRSDGLGLGSVRVRGVASRQMSVRVRGYL